jgi:hypothetical protein
MSPCHHVASSFQLPASSVPALVVGTSYGSGLLTAAWVASRWCGGLIAAIVSWARTCAHPQLLHAWSTLEADAHRGIAPHVRRGSRDASLPVQAGRTPPRPPSCVMQAEKAAPVPSMLSVFSSCITRLPSLHAPRFTCPSSNSPAPVAVNSREQRHIPALRSAKVPAHPASIAHCRRVVFRFMLAPSADNPSSPYHYLGSATVPPCPVPGVPTHYAIPRPRRISTIRLQITTSAVPSTPRLTTDGHRLTDIVPWTPHTGKCRQPNLLPGLPLINTNRCSLIYFVACRPFRHPDPTRRFSLSALSTRARRSHNGNPHCPAFISRLQPSPALSVASLTTLPSHDLHIHSGLLKKQSPTKPATFSKSTALFYSLLCMCLLTNQK